MSGFTKTSYPNSPSGKYQTFSKLLKTPFPHWIHPFPQFEINFKPPIFETLNPSFSHKFEFRHVRSGLP